jgi:hypothetical protein
MATSTVESLQLDPPKFTVDEENGDLELWSFRLPVSLSVDGLKGVKFDPSNGSATFTAADGKEYRIQLGDAGETESFRVLVPKKKENGEKDDDDDKSSSSSSDDDEDDEDGTNGETTKGSLRPCKVAFSKHFQVLASVPVLTESQLAPQEGPPPVDRMRHAYAPIAQRTGLKRRWTPIGVARIDEEDDRPKPTKRTVENKKKQVASKKETHKSAGKMEIDSPPSKRIKQEQADSEDSDDDSSSSPGDKKLSKSERKVKKAEKKAAKKAKKEAKKAKKEAKKAKKEKSKS